MNTLSAQPLHVMSFTSSQIGSASGSAAGDLLGPAAAESATLGGRDDGNAAALFPVASTAAMSSSMGAVPRTCASSACRSTIACVTPLTARSAFSTAAEQCPHVIPPTRSEVTACDTTSASKPTASTASTRAVADAAPRMVAAPESRSTVTEWTPSTPLRARSTLATQWPHVIPRTSSVRRSAVSAAFGEIPPRLSASSRGTSISCGTQQGSARSACVGVSAVLNRKWPMPRPATVARKSSIW